MYRIGQFGKSKDQQQDERIEELEEGVGGGDGTVPEHHHEGNGDMSLALGFSGEIQGIPIDPPSAGSQSIALGAMTSAEERSISIGTGANANGYGSVAVGVGSYAEGEVGAAPTGSIAVGDTAQAMGVYSLAHGAQTQATAPYAMAFGFRVVASEEHTAVMGTNRLRLQRGINAPSGNTTIGVQSPDGTEWVIGVNNDGALTVDGSPVYTAAEVDGIVAGLEARIAALETA